MKKKNGFLEEIQTIRDILPVYEDRFHKAEAHILKGKGELPDEFEAGLEETVENIHKAYRQLRGSLVKAENATEEAGKDYLPFIQTIFGDLIRQDSALLQFYYTVRNASLAIKASS